MKLHYRFWWRLIRKKKDVKFDFLAGQDLSPVSLRNPDQLGQARCPNLEANREVRLAGSDQLSVGLVLVSHWLYKEVDSERMLTGVGISHRSHGLRLRGLRLG
jgi:hypothetical protein